MIAEYGDNVFVASVVIVSDFAILNML